MARSGWVLVYGGILALAVAGYHFGKEWLVYAGAGLWMGLVLVPALLAGKYHRFILQQRYGKAKRVARVMQWLHPGDGWREQPEIVDALMLAQRGELEAAKRRLARVQAASPKQALTAIVHLHRLAGEWEGLLAWLEGQQQISRGDPQLLPVLLRGYGETGNYNALVELYGRKREQIARLAPASSRDFCRLMLFAFSGERERVERMFEGSLSDLPERMQRFWVATAEAVAGEVEGARARLEDLKGEADASMQMAITRRLERLGSMRVERDASAEEVLAEAAREFEHEETFDAPRPLFSKAALGTQLMIWLNVAAFGVEVWLGGSTDPDTLYRMGAMFPPAVQAGEWWRVVAALFLHFGPLHLGMNMLGLWLLGPFTEFGLGFRRFMILYFGTGIGSMLAVMWFGSGPHGTQITVGASGSVLGLVGATGALMLRGWLRDRAHSARRRFLAVILIVAMQTVFDSVVPQVSMTAHLSGALIGFGMALVLRDRLGGRRGGAKAG